MRKIKIFVCTLLLLAESCNYKSDETISNEGSIKPISNEILETSVLYEVNVRQYSKEGTFSAFTKDIPKLKDLGVKIIWLMPIFPISKIWYHRRF